MRDLSFDGLSLAFLKNLEKISFVSSVSRGSAREDLDGSGSGSGSAAESRRRDYVYRVERSVVFEHGGSDQDAVLRSVTVFLSHSFLLDGI